MSPPGKKKASSFVLRWGSRNCGRMVYCSSITVCQMIPSVGARAAMKSPPVHCALILSLLMGCAGSHAPIAPTEAHEYEGRIVESVELIDGRVVIFDPWETAGLGLDTRGRIQRDAVVGYVEGAPTRVLVVHVEKLHLGVDDSTRRHVSILVGLAFVATVAVVAFVLYGFGGFSGLN